MLIKYSLLKYSDMSGAFEKLIKGTINFVVFVCPSVLPYGKTRLPLNGFSLNLMFKEFSRVCRENLSLIKI
jgi:hypothetical protein